MQRARCPWPGSETQVLQRSIWSPPRAMSNILLSFPFLPWSILLTGAPVPVPAASTTYINAPPPNQTPFVRQMPEPALLEQMPLCVPHQTNIATSTFPVCCTYTWPHIHAARGGLLSTLQDGALSHRPPSPRLQSCSQPNGHPGTPCGCLSCSQYQGCPATSQPPSPGRASKVLPSQ